MRIEDKYIKSGYFWLPGKKDNLIPGVLSISDGGRAELEIMGNFDEDKKTQFISQHDDLSLKRIIGFVENDGLVTLDNCFYTKKGFSFGNITKSKILANLVLSGGEWKMDEVITFNTFSFSVDCLDEWIGINGLNVMHSSERDSININYTLPEEIALTLDNSMELEICFQYALSANISYSTGATLTQKSYFTLKSEESRNLKDFMHIAYMITNFMCFAIDEVVTMKNVSATSTEIQTSLSNNKKYPVTIKIYYQSIPYSEKIPKRNLHEMLFRFSDIRDNVQKVFNNWINFYKYLSPAFSLYFSAKAGDQKYLDGKFLALAQGLETYHRRTSDEKLMETDVFEALVLQILDACPKEHIEWIQGRLMHGNEINLGKRLKRVIEPFKNFLGTNKERNKLLRQIVDTRNYLTHYNENLKKSMTKGRDLWILCLNMEIIFQFHFLHVLGFTTEDIENMIKNCTKLKSKLEEIKKQNRSS